MYDCTQCLQPFDPYNVGEFEARVEIHWCPSCLEAQLENAQCGYNENGDV